MVCPFQTNEFDEYTVVLNGLLNVETNETTFFVNAGQAIIIQKGERVRYRTPHPSRAKYIAICLPGFSPGAVHHEE
ncbi:MAG: hypothetical protein SGI98_03195 [Verrucomicrobiota bacterium]|nr:hypothetical protein [Verrucomicrobiota bacterium]